MNFDKIDFELVKTLMEELQRGNYEISDVDKGSVRRILFKVGDKEYDISFYVNYEVRLTDIFKYLFFKKRIEQGFVGLSLVNEDLPKYTSLFNFPITKKEYDILDDIHDKIFHERENKKNLELDKVKDVELVEFLDNVEFYVDDINSKNGLYSAYTIGNLIIDYYNSQMNHGNENFDRVLYYTMINKLLFTIDILYYKKYNRPMIEDDVYRHSILGITYKNIQSYYRRTDYHHITNAMIDWEEYVKCEDKDNVPKYSYDEMREDDKKFVKMIVGRFFMSSNLEERVNHVIEMLKSDNTLPADGKIDKSKFVSFNLDWRIDGV